MTFVFRISQEQLLDELNELIKAGIVDYDGSIYVIRKFQARQKAMETNERSLRYRETKQKEEYHNLDNRRNEDATICDADIELELDTDIDTEQINTETPVVVAKGNKSKAANALIARGLSQETVQELLPLRTNAELLDYCTAYDEAVDNGQAKHKGWLVTAIRKGFVVKHLLKAHQDKVLATDPAHLTRGFETFVN
jgi:hypothetical protein